MLLSLLGWAVLLANLSNFVLYVEALPPYNGDVDISKTIFSESLTTTTLELSSIETIPCTDSTATTTSKSVATTPVLDETTYTTISETFTETVSCSTSGEALSTSNSWTTATVVESFTKTISCSTCKNSLLTIISLSTETLSSLVPVSTITVPVPSNSSASSSWTTITRVESITETVPCSHCANSLTTVVSLTTETLTSLMPVSTIAPQPSSRTTITSIKSITKTVTCSTCANVLSTIVSLTTETLKSVVSISTTSPTSSVWTTITVVESSTDIVTCSTCAKSLQTIYSLTTQTLTSLISESAHSLATASTNSGSKTVSLWDAPLSTASIVATGSIVVPASSAGTAHVTQKTSTNSNAAKTWSHSGASIISATDPIGSPTSRARTTSVTHETSTSESTAKTWSHSGVSIISATDPIVVPTSRASTTSVGQETSTSESSTKKWTPSGASVISATESAVTPNTSVSMGATSAVALSSVRDTSTTISITSPTATTSATDSSSMIEPPVLSTYGPPILPTFSIETSSINWSHSIVSGSSPTTQAGAPTNTPASSSNPPVESIPTTIPTGIGFSSSVSSTTGLPVLSDTSATDTTTNVRATLPAESSTTIETSSGSWTSLAGSGTSATDISTSQGGISRITSAASTQSSSATDNAIASGISSGLDPSSATKSTINTASSVSADSSLAPPSTSASDTVSVTKTAPRSSVTVATTETESGSSLTASTNGSQVSVSAIPTSQGYPIGISSFMPTKTATNSATITGFPESSTAHPPVSVVVVSGTTASYTATQIPSDATLTAALSTTTTDASGSAIGIIIYPSASGWGWAYPCTLGCTAPPFPPQPSCPPIAASVLSCYGGALATGSDSITSTMTTLPPGFSTEATTNTIWTGNTWLTTEVGGQQTIVPILVGCKSCGSHGGGLILWNLPEIPDVEFKLPGFPGLPSFHLPCIKIFGIKISGDCEEPPETDDDNNDDSNQSGTKVTYTFSHESTSLPTTFRTANSFSTTRTSSSSACSITQTASDCSIVCRDTSTSGASAASGTQSCSTTCYSTVTGCSATGITTTASRYFCAQDTCPQCTEDSVTADFPQTSYTCIDCLPGTGLLSVPLSTSTFSSFWPTDSPSITKRALPVPSDISVVYDPTDIIIIGEPIQTKAIGPFMVTMMAQKGILIFKPRLYETGGISNAVITNLRERAFSSVLTDLRGCTSVIVVSEEAVWMSHFYEDPSFIEDDAGFTRDVLDAMDGGDGTAFMPGLRQFTEPGGVFAPETNPQAVIVTPSDRPGHPEYESRIKQIQIKLRSIVAGLKTLNADNDVAVCATYSPVRSDFRIAKSLRFANGKVLFQYDPEEYIIFNPGDEGCVREQAAKLKVWVDHNQEPVLEMAWPALPFQTSTQAATQAAKLRRAIQSGGHCSVSLSSSQTISSTKLVSTVATFTGASSKLETSTSLSSGITASPTLSSLFCFPSSGPGSPPSGIPQNQIAKNVSDFCTAVDLFSQKTSPGCDSQHHNGILLSSDCKGVGNTTSGLAFVYPAVTEWLNVTLVQGKSFVLNSSTCNSAFTTVLSSCPPFAGDNILLPPNKYGGTVFISDGTGGGANFIINLEPATSPGHNGNPGCAYVISKDLQNKALCEADYCNCGGTVAPLLTNTVSGSTTLNCDYSTQPATATCPPSPLSTKSATTVKTDTTRSTINIPVSPPTPTSSAVVPEAKCVADANFDNTAVTIWTNYITDNGAALQEKEMHSCPGLQDWIVTNEVHDLVSPDGTTWFASQVFTFSLQVTHPQELECVQKGIVAAGGPSNTPPCSFSAAIKPP